ncbi:ABC transporter ATP-binding protein [Candidatus Albibeggiatoa sp. nov. BB20]|uniref:ABC transporter ATP-binding protein n=1 Tax=Candidatus Albibeggiatoa sp. nov. BB20 TaxID=3162723 RepID=UPI0033653622
MQHLLQLEQVSHCYQMGRNKECVIHDLTMQVPKNKMTVLVGPSGCGKSTLINLIAGFEKPEQGEIRLNDKRVTAPSHDRMVVFQESALMPWLSVYDNIIFGPKLRNESSLAEIRSQADALLEKVGLTGFAKQYPAQLSGGMQRRAELARALINQPQLMLMDEPFRGLDALSHELMQDFFLQLFEETKNTCLFVTSEIEEAILLADQLVILSNRPAQIRAVLNIDLPRPRTHEMLNSKQAYEYKRQALEILYQEALKNFQREGKLDDFLEAYSQRATEPQT